MDHWDKAGYEGQSREDDEGKIVVGANNYCITWSARILIGTATGIYRLLHLRRDPDILRPIGGDPGRADRDVQVILVCIGQRLVIGQTDDDLGGGIFDGRNPCGILQRVCAA